MILGCGRYVYNVPRYAKLSSYFHKTDSDSLWALDVLCLTLAEKRTKIRLLTLNSDRISKQVVDIVTTGFL